MYKHFYVFILSILSLSAFAADIKGTVTDNKNSSPLMGVVVSLTGTTNGSVTDMDGKYELTGLADGTYEIQFSYTSYKIYKQSITITGGQDVLLDMKMMPETTELKDHTVKSARLTNTESSVINEIKTSSTIVSGTSAAQISKTMDRNAADVVKRIPGVAVQDDRFVVIRGLPDRYNTVWLNDASTPSSEADKKAFSFDIIPAGLIDRILVFKTPSPELPGDFAGGMVKVYTTSIADKNQLTVSLQTSSREFTTGTDFNYNAPGKTDWLGYDDGKRSIPGAIPGRISTKDPDYKTSIESWSKAFGNDWIVNSTKTNPDVRFSMALSNVVKFKKFKIGNTLGLAYSNTYSNFKIHRQDWDSISKNYNYIDQRSVNNVSTGIMDNIGIAIGNTKIEFKNLYNQIGTSSLTIRNSVRDTSLPTAADERAYSMGYESRATYASQLTGSHKNNADTRKYTWALGYTDLFKNQPDLRRIKYVKEQSKSDSFYKAQIANSVDILNGGGRFYSSLYEKVYSFNHQFTQKVKINDGFSFDVSAGNYIEYKKRSFEIRQLGYTLRSGANSLTLPYLPVNKIFADSNVDGANKFKMSEVTNPYDHYDGENRLISSFVSLKVPVGKHINVFGGVRYEYNVQSIKAVINTDTISPEVTTKFLLPSVNASYNFTDKSLVRAAYGKTLNRPEFREWAPTFYYDFDELAGNKGSLFPTTANRNKSGNIGDTLKVAEIQNFDVRYEYYPSPGEMIQVGGFYKSFINPIQRVIVPGSASGDSRTFTFINADKAMCYGVELDVRKSLTFLDDKLGLNVFRNFILSGNLTIAKSELTIDSSIVVGVIPKSTLQGQSGYIVNAGVYYQHDNAGIQSSLLYNVYGPRMYALGTSDAGGESIGEMPFRSLDFAISKLFFKHYIVNIGVQNLLNGRVLFMKDANRDNKFSAKDDRDFRDYYPGRYYTIGVKVRF